MIVVDSSALVAILLAEPEKPAFEELIAGGERCVISAVKRFWQFLADSEIEIVPFDEAQVRVAAIAFDRYGKGIDPKARLNLSDCAAYALAKTMNAPLLFKGGDFAQTDLQSCL